MPPRKSRRRSNLPPEDAQPAPSTEAPAPSAPPAPTAVPFGFGNHHPPPAMPQPALGPIPPPAMPHPAFGAPSVPHLAFGAFPPLRPPTAPHPAFGAFPPSQAGFPPPRFYPWGGEGEEEEPDEDQEEDEENEDEHCGEAHPSHQHQHPHYHRHHRGRLGGKRPRQPPPAPPQPDPFQAAICRFSEVAPSVNSTLAQELLQEALEKNLELKAAVDALTSAHQRAQPQMSSFKDNLNWWIDEAQMRLACQNEFDAEKVDLEQAMALSLKEAEAERLRKEAEEQQLGQAAALQRKFGESLILRKLVNVAQISALLSSRASQPLHKLLTLEKKCKHWYTGRGTFVYFENLGRELEGHTRTLASQQGITQLPIQCSSHAPPPAQQNGSADGASTSAPATDSQPNQQADALSPSASQCLEQLGQKLESTEQFLQAELARMPDDTNQAIYVPQVFKLPPGMDEREVVDAFSDD